MNNATRRADFSTQAQGFRTALSLRLHNLRTTRILAEQEEEDVAAKAGRLTDRVIADQEEGDAAAEEHK